MNKEPNKPVEQSEDKSRELTDEELEGVVGGGIVKPPTLNLVYGCGTAYTL